MAKTKKAGRKQCLQCLIRTRVLFERIRYIAHVRAGFWLVNLHMLDSFVGQWVGWQIGWYVGWQVIWLVVKLQLHHMMSCGTRWYMLDRLVCWLVDILVGWQVVMGLVGMFDSKSFGWQVSCSRSRKMKYQLQHQAACGGGGSGGTNHGLVDSYSPCRNRGLKSGNQVSERRFFIKQAPTMKLQQF